MSRNWQAVYAYKNYPWNWGGPFRTTEDQTLNISVTGKELVLKQIHNDYCQTTALQSDNQASASLTIIEESLLERLHSTEPSRLWHQKHFTHASNISHITHRYLNIQGKHLCTTRLDKSTIALPWRTTCTSLWRDGWAVPETEVIARKSRNSNYFHHAVL